MEKKKRFLISVAYYISVAAIIFFGIKYVLDVVAPFAAGFAIAAVLNPAVRFLSSKYKMRRRPTAVFTLLCVYATLGTLITIGVLRLIIWLGNFSENLPELYTASVEPVIGRVYEWISTLVSRFAPTVSGEVVGGIGGIFEAFSTSLATAVSDVSVRALSALSGSVAAIPRLIISLGFTVISSFFFILDFESVLGFLKSRLPKRAVDFMRELRGKFFATTLKYLRSYALIMLITFALLFFGLSVIGTKNAAVVALIIALLDVLPVIGTGLVILPWALIAMLGGRVGYGIGLIVIWAVIAVTRNVIEPKIVGKQVGLHPLVTLIAMFVGTKLFGFIGLVVLPLGLSVAVSVLRERGQPSGE